MLEQRELPALSEIPDGWRLVRTGKAQLGDKYWRPADRIWLPVLAHDLKCDRPVSLVDMPVIIRKEKQ